MVQFVLQTCCQYSCTPKNSAPNSSVGSVATTKNLLVPDLKAVHFSLLVLIKYPNTLWLLHCTHCLIHALPTKSDLWIVGSQCRVPTFSVSANIQFTQFCFLLRVKRNQFYNFKVRDKRPHWLRCDVQIVVFEMKNSFHLKIPLFPNFLHNKNTALL